MSSLRILYDGWPLARQPDSPAALHLLAILAHLPETVEPVLALPEQAPPWAPAAVEHHVAPAGETPGDRLRWEQRTLPELAGRLAADLLHLTRETPSLMHGEKTVVSPAGYGPPGRARQGWRGRLRGALAAGGMARARAVFWPDDIPPPATLPRAVRLPPVVHPGFEAREHFFPPDIPGIELPGSYVLYHGPQDTATLRRGLEAWTWPANPIGEAYPLVMIGLGKAARGEVQRLVERLDLRGTVMVLPPVPPGWIPALYQAAAAVFHPAEESPWGGALRHGLACGKPVVSLATARNVRLVGPAAYLAEARDTRRLGAEIIGVVVKEPLAKRLQEAALERSRGWNAAGWGEALARGYERVLGDV